MIRWKNFPYSGSSVQKTVSHILLSRHSQGHICTRMKSRISPVFSQRHRKEPTTPSRCCRKWEQRKPKRGWQIEKKQNFRRCRRIIRKKNGSKRNTVSKVSTKKHHSMTQTTAGHQSWSISILANTFTVRKRQNAEQRCWFIIICRVIAAICLWPDRPDAAKPRSGVPCRKSSLSSRSSTDRSCRVTAGKEAITSRIFSSKRNRRCGSIWSLWLMKRTNCLSRWLAPAERTFPEAFRMSFWNWSTEIR